MGHALIDKAAEICGSRYKLAKRLQYSEGTLADIYNGKRALPAGLAARIAEIAGQDARSVVAVALIEAAKDPADREALRRAFFPTGAVIATSMIAALIGLWPTSEAQASPSRVARVTHIDSSSLYIMLT